MSISLATNGRLWPVCDNPLVVREQYTEIVSIIEDPLEIYLEMRETTEVTAVVEVEGDVVYADVEAVDPVESTIVDPDDIDSNTGEC